jgi:uncharacterized short protein YbdD (DUF466 family)
LASDYDSLVRAGVATNPNTPVETLQQLATNESYYVRHLVLQNPNRNQIIERLVFMTDYNQFSS